VRPVVCFITDRRRFGEAWETALVERVRAAATAGVDLIQIRERDLDGGPLARLAVRCVEAVGGTRARVLVNDRLDVALAAGAHGVHLRADSIGASRARAMTPPGFLIGRSVHTVDEALEEDLNKTLDYLIFGTVFETTSKPGRPAAGLVRLAEVSKTTTIPVLAVGGMSAARAGDVARTGAAGLAAIGLLSDCPLEGLPNVVMDVCAAFHTP